MNWNIGGMGMEDWAARTHFGYRIFTSRQVNRWWVALVLAYVLMSAPPAPAEDFGTAKTYDASTANDGNSDDHKLNDPGTEIMVLGDGTYSYTLSGVLSGNGSLTKAGSGTLVLGNANNIYTGATIVTGGVLQMAGRKSINGDVLGNEVRNGATLGSSAELVIGDSDKGSLSITGGGKASAGTYVSLGAYFDSTGTVTVDGTGSALSATSELYVGLSSTGTLDVKNMGTASGADIYLGNNSTGKGTVTVDGPGSALNATDSLQVGKEGTGTLNVTDGGKASADYIVLGSFSDSTGTVTVNGAGSALSATGDLLVGDEGTGTLDVKNKGTASGSDIYLGRTSTGGGTVTVNGTGSALSATDSLQVGFVSTGKLDITGGGKASVGTHIVLGSYSNSTGTVTVDGTGSALSATGNLLIGDSGTGTLNIQNGGTVTAAMISVNAASRINVTGAGTLGNGSYAGDIDNDGALVFNQSVSQTLSGQITGTGAITKAGNGVLTLSGTNTYSGGTTVNGGTLSIDGDNNIGGGINTLRGGTLRLTGTSYAKDWNLTDADNSIENASNAEMSGVISGTGGFTKTGAGVLTLSGANTYSGGTTVSVGRLQIGDGISGSLGNGSYAGNIHNDGELVFNQSVNQTLSGDVTGAGTLTKYGANTLTLSGGLNRSAGSAANASDVSVNGGTLTIAGQGNYAKDVLVDNGARLGLTAGSAAALSARTLSFSGNGGLNITGSTSDGTTVITTTGGVSGFNPANVTVGGGAGVDYAALSAALANNNREVRITTALRWNMTDGSQHGTFTLTGASDSYTVGQALADNLAANTTGWDGQSLTKAGAGTLILTGANTYSGNTTISGGTLQIGNGGTTGSIASPTVTVAGGATLAFNRSDDIAYSGNITGAGGLTKLGAGTLSLTGNNSYSGNTTVNAGTLSIAGDGNIGNGTNTLNGGVLRLTGTSYAKDWALTGTANSIENASDAEVSGVLSGAGGFTKTGAGVLTLSGTNTYSGGTTVSAGTLAIASDNNIGIGTNNVLNGGTLRLTGPSYAKGWTLTGAGSGIENDSDTVISGILSGTGGLTKRGTGIVTLTGANTYAGVTTVSAGTLQIGNGGASGSVAGNILNNAAVIFNRSDAVTYSGVISGSGSLAKQGAGALTLTNGLNRGAGSAATAGDLTINGGTLTIGGQGNYAKDITVNAGAKLGLTTGSAAALSAATLTFNGNGGLNIDGTAADGVALITTTGGVTNFNAANVTVAGGANADYLKVTAELANSNKDIMISTALRWNMTDGSQHGDFTLTGAGDSFTVGQVLADKSANLPWDGKTLTKKGAGTLILTAENTYTGGTKIEAGTVQIGNGGTTGSISDTGGVDVSAGATLAFNRSDDLTYGGAISGGGGLTKQGAGELELSGNNSYTGPTTISAGILNVSGALGGGNYGGAIVNNSALVFSQSANQTLSGAISGAGSLTQSGSAILTLSNANAAYTGDVTVSTGKLALTGSGAIENSRLLLGATGAFDISGIGTGTTTVASFEAAKGSTLAATGKTLDLSGKKLIFDLAGASKDDTVLTVTGNLKIDADTSVLLNKADGSLKKDDVVILAANMTADSVATTEKVTSGRKKFLLSIDGSYNLLATLSGISSFVEATNDFLGDAAPGNINIQNGGAYLDWLLTQPYGEAPDPGMETIEDYFTAITENLSASAARSELKRMYGAYSAYANQALSSDAGRFRQRWRQQNDGFVFPELLSNTAAIGIASASGLASPMYGARQCVPIGQSRVWAGGFGSWAKQDKRSGLSGYKHESYGLALGYEYTIDRLRLGFAGAYSRGDLKVKDLGYKNEADVLNLALYGAYVHDFGFYAEGGIGYGHAWNDYNAHMLMGGKKSGNYGSDVFSADLELGYIARLPHSFNLVPSAGVEYGYLKNGSWTESVSGASNAAIPANRFASGHDHALDIPVGLRVNKAFRFGHDAVIVPEVRAAFVYTANKSRPTIQSGFAGAPGGFNQSGVEPGRSHWRIGAGLSGRLGSRVDFRLDYEFETRSGFKGHSLNAGVGVSF